MTHQPNAHQLRDFCFIQLACNNGIEFIEIVARGNIVGDFDLEEALKATNAKDVIMAACLTPNLTVNDYVRWLGDALVSYARQHEILNSIRIDEIESLLTESHRALKRTLLMTLSNEEKLEEGRASGEERSRVMLPLLRLIMMKGLIGEMPSDEDDWDDDDWDDDYDDDELYDDDYEFSDGLDHSEEEDDEDS